jgi:uncharacterized protein (DUF1810 family)
MEDPYRLERFVSAQDPFYEAVVSELRRRQKAGHSHRHLKRICDILAP